jgi:hypothetical protein
LPNDNAYCVILRGIKRNKEGTRNVRSEKRFTERNKHEEGK